MFRLMISRGLMREVEYLSPTGSEERKTFKELIGERLRFGENVHKHHEFRTELKFYLSRFPDLFAEACAHMESERESMLGEVSDGI
jgi:hypothetical protein